jgi:hypothetical protein
MGQFVGSNVGREGMGSCYAPPPGRLSPAWWTLNTAPPGCHPPCCFFSNVLLSKRFLMPDPEGGDGWAILSVRAFGRSIQV